MISHGRLTKEFYTQIALGIALSIITLGLYNIYWNAKQFRAMNELLGRVEYRFWMWFFLSILTFGLFHIYYEYKMGSDLQQFLIQNNIPVSPHLAIFGSIFAFLGLTVVSDAIYQHELNRLVRD